MEIDGWVGCYKVRVFPWIDGKRIYFNVLYYAPGQSLEMPPVFDKSVFLTDDCNGRYLTYEFTHTLAEHVAGMQIADGTEVTITVDSMPQGLLNN